MKRVTLKIMMGLCLPLTVNAASLDQVKMAFLFNFAQYTHWPDSSFQTAESPFVICLEADTSLTALLQLIVQNEELNNRVFKVVENVEIERVGSCHILFISKSKYSKAFSHISSATLLVSDYDGFATQGGMIEMQQQDRHLKLLINYKAVTNAGLSIRSNLLNLATIVE
ncbi:MAG: YfiR family protein [Methylococcales bacterium]